MLQDYYLVCHAEISTKQLSRYDFSPGEQSCYVDCLNKPKPDTGLLCYLSQIIIYFVSYIILGLPTSSLCFTLGNTRYINQNGTTI